MEHFKCIRFLSITAIFFVCIINFTSSRMSTEDLILRDLAPNSKIRLNYTGYLHLPQITDRTDFIVELIPVYQWQIKPKTITVDDDPLIDLFGVYAAGKVLELDERTQLYKLPPADHDVTEAARMKMMWLDKTYVNYCAEQIGKIGPVDNAKTSTRVICTDDFDEDRCCGEVKKCHCIYATIGCTCISDEAHARRMVIFHEGVEAAKAVKEEVRDIAIRVAKSFVG